MSQKAVYPEGIIYAYQILISIIWWRNTHMLLLRSFERFYGLAENAVDGAFTEVFDNLQISSVKNRQFQWNVALLTTRSDVRNTD